MVASAVNARCPSFGGSVDGRAPAVAIVANGWPPGLAQYRTAAAEREVPFFDAPPPHTQARPLTTTRFLVCLTVHGAAAAIYGAHHNTYYIYIYYVHYISPDSERIHILLLLLYRLRATTAVHRIDSAATAPAVGACALVAFPAMQS